MMRIPVNGLLVGTLALALNVHCSAAEGKKETAEPAQSKQTPQSGESDTMEKAMFAAGCFWGVEAAFGKVDGIKETTVGYSGGDYADPSYKDVCSGITGHAEVVQVIYDPSEVSYDQLLDVFWACHDPTSLNRQGFDIGEQYRSAIFYYTPEQKAAALASKKKLEESGKYKRPIVTQILPAKTFYKAEDYHQDYLAKRGLATCH